MVHIYLLYIYIAVQCLLYSLQRGCRRLYVTHGPPILLDTVTSLSQVSVRLTPDERDSSNEINAPRSTSTGAGCRRHRRGTQNRVQQLHGTANARRPRSICQSLSSSDNNVVTVRDPEEPLYHIVYLFILLKCKGPYGKLTCLKTYSQDCQRSINLRYTSLKFFC